MSQKLNVGVVGLGMGRAHVKGFQELPETEVVAVADLDETRLKTAKEKYGVLHTYTGLEEMLEKEKLDIAVIATPNFLHAPFTLKALEAGCHVLCEKPMALNTEDALKMSEAADKKGKVLMINFSYRFLDSSFSLKEQIESGTIGEVYYARTVWHRRRGFPGFGGWFGHKDKSGGGPLVDLGVHRIDLALWLMGNPEPLSVNAATYNKLITEMIKDTDITYDCEDLALAMVRLENGITMIVEVSWGLHGKNNEYMRTEIYGTKGSAVQRNVNQKYEFEGLLYTEEGKNLYDKKFVRRTDKTPTIYENVVDVIKRKGKNYASCQSGIDVQKILDGIYRSAEEGKEVVF